MMTLVDVIIPVYNRSDLLDRCLEYLPEAAGSLSYTTYVFDNGSSLPQGPQDSPGEAVRIQEICKRRGALYFRSGKNLGFPTACNQAFRKGASPLVFFLNDDVFLMPGSLDRLVRVMDDPKVGVAGMRLLFPMDSQDPTRPAGKIQHVGLSTNIRGEFIHQFVGWSPENPRTFKIKSPIAVTGAALLTRRQLFRQIGGFFEGYGMGTYEDVDYCMSVREMGYNICTEHEAVGFHLTGATATSQKIPYELGKNFDLFRLRWQNKIPYTEWENW